MVPLVLPPDNNCVIENFCQLELGGQEFRHIKELKKQLSTTIRQVEKNHKSPHVFFLLFFNLLCRFHFLSLFLLYYCPFSFTSLRPLSWLFYRKKD